MVEVATQSDHSALATRHTNLTAVVTQLQRDLTALQARVQTIEDETEPIPAAPANRQATLDMVGSTWQTRQAEPWPGIHTPPGLTFNDNQPYIGHTEIYSGTPRPIYAAAINAAQHLRWQADQWLVNGTPPEPRFYDLANAWSQMNPQTSIGPWLSQPHLGQISTSCNTMPAIFLACADTGHQPPGAAAWANRCRTLLQDLNFKYSHNFRLSVMFTLCAALSCDPNGPTSQDVEQIAAWLNNHMSRTLKTTAGVTDQNTHEQDRQRSVHYQLIELQTAALIQVWLTNQGHQGLAGWPLTETRQYLAWLQPVVAACVDWNPTPTGTPYRYQNSAGTHIDIGPISKGLFGPTAEWVNHTGWATNKWPVPYGKGQTMIYKAHCVAPR